MKYHINTRELFFFFQKMITCKKSRYTSYFRYSDNPFHLINQYLHLKVDTFKSIYEGFTTMFEIYINELTIITRGTPKKILTNNPSYLI